MYNDSNMSRISFVSVIACMFLCMFVFEFAELIIIIKLSMRIDKCRLQDGNKIKCVEDKLKSLHCLKERMLIGSVVTSSQRECMSFIKAILSPFFLGAVILWLQKLLERHKQLSYSVVRFIRFSFLSCQTNRSLL